MTDEKLRRAYQAMAVTSYHRRMKLKAIEYKGGKCQQCGYSKSPAALVFHHRDTTEKDFNIGSRVVKWEVLEPELMKCDLLCQNCHHELHERLFLEKTKDLYLSIRVVVPERKTEIDLLTVSCAACGKEFQRLESQIRFEHTFCSTSCRASYQERVVWPDKETLSKLVLDFPVTFVAKQIGVSDVAVKKRCQKLGIQTPGRGYWMKQKSLVVSDPTSSNG